MTDITRSKRRTCESYQKLIADTYRCFPVKRVDEKFPCSLSEWQEYSVKLRSDLLLSLGIPDERVDLDVHIKGTVELPGIVIEKIIYCAEPGSLITADLYRPDVINGTVPAFIMCSGSNATKDTDFNQIMGQYLAHAGCICLIPDNIGEGDRRNGGCHIEYVDEALKLGKQLFGKMIFDLVRGVDYLYTRPEVDKSKIGCSGHSLGGGLCACLAALDIRIQLSIPASPGFLTKKRSAPEWWGMGAQAPLGMGRLAKSVELISLVAPRKMLIITADKDFSDPDVLDMNAAYARRVFGLYGKQENLAVHRVTDGSGHGPHFLSQEAFRYINDNFGFPRFDSTLIESLKMVAGVVEWYPKCSIIDMDRHVFKSIPLPYQNITTHCPELDCLDAHEVCDTFYGISGWLKGIRHSNAAKIPIVDTWKQWQDLKKEIVAALKDIMKLPSLPVDSQPLRIAESIEKNEKWDIKLVTLGLPPVEGYLLSRPEMASENGNSESEGGRTEPGDEKSGNGEEKPVSRKAIICLHESRTKEGALACKELAGYIDRGYDKVLLMDSVASDYSYDFDVYMGFFTTAVNVENVLQAVDYFAASGIKEIAVHGEIDDIAVYAGILDERIKSVVNGEPAGTQHVNHIPRDWGWTRWEGTVPGIDIMAEGSVLMACLAPRDLALKFRRIPDFVSRIYELYLT